MKARGVIWDLDGTLADTAEAHFRAWVTALAEWEVPFDRDTFADVFGMNNQDTLVKVLGRPPKPKEFGTITARKEHFFRLEAQRIARPLPGALELLKHLDDAGWRQALATSAPWANINLVVDKFDIRNRFQVIFSGEDLPHSKPDPALFLEAAKALDLPPKHCVVIEDSPVGVEAAVRAEMRCIAVLSHGQQAALTRHGIIFPADLTAVTPDRVAELLEGGL